MTRTRRSLLLSLADSVIGLPLQLVGTMVISRLLTPSEVGVFAVGAVFLSLASTVRDFGVAEYLIQESEVDATKFRAALGVNIAISWTLALLLVAISPLATSFYRHAGVGEVLRILAMNLLLIPFGAVIMAMFRRDMNFRPVVAASLMANVASFVVSIGCAYAGLSYQSLAWSSLAGTAVTIGVALANRPRGLPLLPGLKGAKRVIEFGRFASVTYIFGQVSRSAPELVIGRATNVADVATFSRGGGLVELVNRLLVRSVASVYLPHFAQAHRAGTSLGSEYLRGVTLITGVGWPSLVFVAGAAFAMIRVLYGAQWLDAVPLAQILAAVAAVELIHVFSREALMAVGEVRRSSSLQLTLGGLRIVGLLLVLPFGLHGAAWGLLLSAAAGLVASQRVLNAALGLTWGELARACLPSAWVALACAAPLAALLALSPPTESSHRIWLAAAVTSTLAAGLVALRLTDHPGWHEIRRLAASLRARLMPARS